MHRGCTKGSVFAERAETGGTWVCLKGEVGESSAGQAEGKTNIPVSCVHFAGNGVRGTWECAHAYT